MPLAAGRDAHAEPGCAVLEVEARARRGCRAGRVAHGLLPALVAAAATGQRDERERQRDCRQPSPGAAAAAATAAAAAAGEAAAAAARALPGGASAEPKPDERSEMPSAVGPPPRSPVGLIQ